MIEEAHSDWIAGLAFAPDASYVVSTSDDGTVRRFTIDPDQILAIARSEIRRNPTTAECERYTLSACG